MDTKSTHIIAEYWGCPSHLLDDVEELRNALIVAASVAQATLVDAVFHKLSSRGIAGVIVVEESHFSIHTWPEQGYAACDFFTCGECDPMAAHNALIQVLGVEKWHLLEINRGISDSIPHALPLSSP